MTEKDKNNKIIPSKSPINRSPAREVRISEDDINQGAKPKKKRRWWLWIVAVLVLGILSYFGYNAYAVAKRIITNNNSGGSPFLKFLDDMDATQLRGEGDGRINILLLGIAGEGHDGPDLSDTIMVVSVDPINKNIAMLSIPRDLYVDIPGNGESKINSVHAYGEQNKEEFEDGPTLAKETISEILDLPIHYYFRMDFEGFEKLIDELGGIDVNVEESIYDPYYPDDRPNRYGTITYRISEGQHHMDGLEALRYARSRYTTSDFDRAKRQQIILKAVKEKALSIGILANPAKLSAIMNIIGDHFRTDMQIAEMQRFIELIRDVDTNTIAHKVLDNTEEGLLYDSRVNGAYVLLPRGGNFKEIQALAHSIFIEPYIKKENARIEIQNGTGRVGAATEFSERLKEFGYNIVNIKNAPPGDYTETLIIDYTNGGKPYTIQLLSNRVSFAKLLSDSNPPPDSAEIVIILGDNYKNI